MPRDSVLRFLSTTILIKMVHYLRWLPTKITLAISLPKDDRARHTKVLLLPACSRFFLECRIIFLCLICRTYTLLDSVSMRKIVLFEIKGHVVSPQNYYT